MDGHPRYNLRSSKKRRRSSPEATHSSDSDEDYVPSSDPASSSETDDDEGLVITSDTHLDRVLFSALLAPTHGTASGKSALEEEEEREQKYVRSLSRRERAEYRRKEEELDEEREHRVPLRCQVVQLPIRASAKLVILERIKTLQQMEENASELPKLQQWVNAVLKLPFGKYEEVPVSIQDTPSQIRSYLRGIRLALDATVHGHDLTKNDIMQLVSQWISNPQSMSQVLGIAGPPGTGKTTLVRHGIAKALGRPFVQISLGGATDACTLNGHSYTYEGATWGRIASHLMQTRCMNPVIFFDEVDKVSESQTGQEIIGLLIHLTDSTQNEEFTDRYFDGVPLDLSRALMIFSFNDADAINPILRDRMTIVGTEPFRTEDKVKIATRHLLPAILKTVGFHRSEIMLRDEDARYMIDRFSLEEEGVRNLKRALHKIAQRLNVLRLTDGRLREGSASRDTMPELPYRLNGSLRFPLYLTRPVVDALVPKSEEEHQPGRSNRPPPLMYT